jgi:hypothetical protein
MKIISIIFSLLSSASLVNQEVMIDGNSYQVITTETKLQCDNFSIKAETLRLPSHLHHSQIPKELSIGHAGGNFVGHKIQYTSQSVMSEIVGIKQQLKGYEKLAKKRVYIAKPVKCLSDYNVLISLYGGGNCDTVCEAYATLKFNKQGEIVDAKGLSYQEFTDLKQN